MSVSYEQWYADLCDALSDVLPPRYFTLQQFAESAGLTESTARRRLAERVRQGELQTKLATVDGFEQRVFWPAPGVVDE